MKKLLHFFRLHQWEDTGVFIAEGSEFTRQQCRICEKTRCNKFIHYEGKHVF